MKITDYESFGKALVRLRDGKVYDDDEKRAAYSAIMFFVNEKLEERYQAENRSWELDKKLKELEKKLKIAIGGNDSEQGK